MNKKILGYYDYTVILTYCGAVCALIGILHTLSGSYWSAVICLMIAGLCDMFDGTVASTKKRDVNEKRFGIQIDSLCDLINFGVFPGIFVYMISDQSIVIKIISSVYILCALIRLAFFNVLEEERQQQTAEHRKSYLGIPVTTIAAVLPAVYILYQYNIFKSRIVFPLLLAALAVGFLSPVGIKKPGALGKVCIISIGLLEALGMIFLFGVDLV